MRTLRNCIVAWLLVAVVSPLSPALWPSGTLLVAQDAFRLMSAQVITRTQGPPTLKLAANGPIAFSVVPAGEGESAAPNRLKARLHGVVPGDVATSGLEPYVLVALADGQDTILTVTAPSNLKIELRAGMKSSEVVVTATVNQ